MIQFVTTINATLFQTTFKPMPNHEGKRLKQKPFCIVLSHM